MLDGAAKLKDLCNNRSHYPNYVDPDTGLLYFGNFARDNGIGEYVTNKAGKSRWQFPPLTINASWNTTLLAIDGASFDQCTIKDVNFVQCSFSAVDFTAWRDDAPTMENVRFTQTSLTEAVVSRPARNFHFVSGTLTEVTFDSGIAWSTFKHTQLILVKFEEGITSCQFEDLSIDPLIFSVDVSFNTFTNVQINRAWCTPDLEEFESNTFQDSIVGTLYCSGYGKYAAVFNDFRMPGVTLNNADFSGRRMNGNFALGVNNRTVITNSNFIDTNVCLDPNYPDLCNSGNGLKQTLEMSGARIDAATQFENPPPKTTAAPSPVNTTALIISGSAIMGLLFFALMVVLIVRRNRANNRPDPWHIRNYLTRVEKELALTQALAEFDRKAMLKLEKKSKGVFPRDILMKIMVEDVYREAREYRQNYVNTGSFAPQSSNRWRFFTGRQNAEHLRFCDSVGRTQYRMDVIKETWAEIANAREEKRLARALKQNSRIEVLDDDDDDTVRETEPLLLKQVDGKGKEEEELREVVSASQDEEAPMFYQNSNGRGF